MYPVSNIQLPHVGVCRATYADAACRLWLATRADQPQQQYLTADAGCPPASAAGSSGVPQAAQPAGRLATRAAHAPGGHADASAGDEAHLAAAQAGWAWLLKRAAILHLGKVCLLLCFVCLMLQPGGLGLALLKLLLAVALTTSGTYTLPSRKGGIGSRRRAAAAALHPPGTMPAALLAALQVRWHALAPVCGA